jgi:hypothetical protein
MQRSVTRSRRFDLHRQPERLAYHHAHDVNAGESRHQMRGHFASASANREFDQIDDARVLRHQELDVENAVRDGESIGDPLGQRFEVAPQVNVIITRISKLEVVAVGQRRLRLVTDAENRDATIPDERFD